jgi:hypothetical protein
LFLLRRRCASTYRSQRICFEALAILMTCTTMFWPAALLAETVPVRHTEGLVHGFLVLRTLQGNALADGELIQVSKGDRVTIHLVFRFKDGSVHDETTVFTQRQTFQLVSEHLVQKGPTFQHPMDVSIDALTGEVNVNYTDGGSAEHLTKHLDLPSDVSNGIVLTLLKNVRVASSLTLSMVAATPKPRIVKLVVSSKGEDDFWIGSTKRTATHYVVKVEIGGAAGLLVQLLGKQPPDTSVWILGGEAPAFVKSEGPLFEGGPVWKIELASPKWGK